MHRHRHRPRMPERQPDLFLTVKPPDARTALGWDSLPDPARHAVTALMVRLLIAYAGDTVQEIGGDVDEL